jgi:conjugal transfer/entry exclusion protein
MKFKKLFSLMLVVVTVLSVSSFAVSAQETTDYGYVATTATNTSVNDFSYKIRLAIVEKLVEATNNQIEQLVNQAQNQQNPDIDKLVATTSALSQATIQVAALLGIDVVCEYVPYVINGQTVYIDPLIVIKR